MSTGYEITFSDFCLLLSYPDHRPHVAPLISRWFDCEIAPTDDGFVLRDSRGVEVSPQTVHEAIQADHDRQYSIYQTAMSLWR